LTNSEFKTMIRSIEPTCFLEESTHYPVIDVRSPGEYLQGHIPGAISIPLFTDQERADVGTLYVQTGRDAAILRGLDIALPKTGWYLETLRKNVNTGRLLLHCWRGGLRSTLMAEVFGRAGFEVELLNGGYKAYRNLIRHRLSQDVLVVVLGGFTGSGKTALLHQIASLGEQIVDLEELACHKGSAFGSFGQQPQPSNEQFENNLYTRWSKLDLSRRIWLEDESRMIGRITMPEPVFHHISKGVLIKVMVDKGYRIGRLVAEYAGFEKHLLAGAIEKIADRLGGEKARDALKALDDNRFSEVAAAVLHYYDKAYLHSISRRINPEVHEVPISGTDARADAQMIIDFANHSLNHGTDLP